MTAFGRGANEQDFPLQFASPFGRGWVSQLPSICSFFIHYMESLRTKAWNSLIIMTVVFVSPLGSTTPFSRSNSLSQHTYVLVMNQEERHAFLSNVQMTNNWAFSFTVCGQPQQNVRECAPDSQRPKGRELPTNIYM